MTKKDLSKKIIHQIKSNHIAIKPKIYFALGSVLFSFGLSAVFVLSVYFLSQFIFRYELVSFIANLYPQGRIRHFVLANLSFDKLIISVILLFIGQKVLKKSGFAYKFNPLLVFITTIILVVVLGYLANLVGLPHRFR